MKRHSINVKRNKCLHEIITIYIIWVNTHLLFFLGILRKGKIGVKAFQNNLTPPTKQEQHCQRRRVPCLIFFNSISFSLFSRSQEIHLISHIKAETKEMNKRNAFTLLGHECNSKQRKACYSTTPILSLRR